MSEPYIGELKLVGFAFAPPGWAFCDGQPISVAEYSALFAVIGTRYGGNGQTVFNLPDLRGRVPVHRGRGLTVGQQGGEATHTLTAAEMPMHNHLATAQRTASSASPAGAVWASTSDATYASPTGTPMAGAAVATSGGGQPHENRPPYLTVNWIIALQGIYPSRD